MARLTRLRNIARAGYGQYRRYRRYEAGRDDVAPQAFVEELVKLGPTLVKLGQIRSTRPDVVRQTLVDQFGAPPDLHFSHFEPTPVAAAPVADSLGATFTTHLAVATLALIEVLCDHGVARDRAYESIYETGWRLHTKMGEPPLLVATAYTKDPIQRLRIATDLFRLFPFGEPGYRWQDVDGPSDVVAEAGRSARAHGHHRLAL